MSGHRACHFCGMEFPNGQALEGHLRFHLKTEDSNGSVGGIDLLKGLPGWAKTNKRGSQSATEAALGLVQLSQDAFDGPIELPNSDEPETSPEKSELEESSSNGPREEGTGCEKTEAGQNPGRGVFEGHTGKMVFPSFQALPKHNNEKGTTTMPPPPPPPHKHQTRAVAAAAAAADRADKGELRDGPRATDAEAGGSRVHKVVVMGLGDPWATTVQQGGQGDHPSQPPSTGLKDGPSHGAREDRAGPGALDIDLNKPPQIDLNDLPPMDE